MFVNAGFQVRFLQEEIFIDERPFGRFILIIELLANSPLNGTGMVRVTTQDGTAFGNHLTYQ